MKREIQAAPRPAGDVAEALRIVCQVVGAPTLASVNSEIAALNDVLSVQRDDAGAIRAELSRLEHAAGPAEAARNSATENAT